ncbi:MAG: hypothetical protein HON04_04670 [Planctomicrobium sp.]|jgi:hypothetical protein|nr:hypothetical protein [Planctomicrobium sp.]
MRIANALAFILISQLFSLSIVQSEEFPPPRLVRRNEIVTPPSSGPIKKLQSRQRVLDLNTVELVEFSEPAPVPEVPASVSIEEFLEGTEVKQPKKFPSPNQQQHVEKESNSTDWHQPVLKVAPNWNSSTKTKSAQTLQYQSPRQEDVWEATSKKTALTSNHRDSNSSYVTQPHQISPPPPPLEETDRDLSKEYNPMPDAHTHGAWQPLDTVTEGSLPYYSDSYYESVHASQASPYYPEECETCWQEGDVWIEGNEVFQEYDHNTAIQSDFTPVLLLGAKGGNDRSLGEVGVMLPLWQSENDLLFGEIQGQFSDNEENEGYFGLGFRTYLDTEWIFGTYASYDFRETSEQNRFHQLTVGLEVMSPVWDFRVNGHFPNEGYKSSPLSTGISNGTIVTNNFQERAYRGFNAELGRRILRWGRFDTNEVRWFVGYYSFDTKATGFRKIDGPRTRVEYRSYDLPFLGPQSRLTAGFEYSNDNLREDQYWGFLRVQIPLAPLASRTPLDPVRRRFMDQAVRRID